VRFARDRVTEGGEAEGMGAKPTGGSILQPDNAEPLPMVRLTASRLSTAPKGYVACSHGDCLLPAAGPARSPRLP
jgi:hypothetical protein